MAEPQDSCVGWWKLEDRFAEIGPDFNITGFPTWPLAKFNNGVYSNNDANYLSIGAGNWFNPNQFIVEAWIKTPYSVTNGIPSDAGMHMLFSWYVNDSNYIYFRAGAIGVYFVFKIGGGGSLFSLMTNIDWSANTLHHLMIVYSQTKNGLGADQQRVYLDELMVENKNTAYPNQVQTTGTFDLLTFWGHVQNWGGLADNLKIYNNTTIINAIKANKDNEGWPSVWTPPNKFNRVAGLKAGLPL